MSNHPHVFRRALLVFVLLLPGPLFAAGFQCEQPAEMIQQDNLEELEEIVVTGEKTRTRSRDLKEWLSLLAGRYTYKGYVDLCGQSRCFCCAGSQSSRGTNIRERR